MNGSAWVILGLGIAGVAVYLMNQPKTAAETTGAADTGSSPAPHVSLDISNQIKTGAGPLSFADVAGYASDAGFSGDDLSNMVAVCFAESGGNPDALNSNGSVAPREGSATDVYSVGLWQINLKAHPMYQDVNLFDPVVNAGAAFEIFRSQGLKAWGGYTSGNYARYLSQAQAVSA